MRKFHIDGNNFCVLVSLKNGIAWRHTCSAGFLHEKAYIYIYSQKQSLELRKTITMEGNE
jgi:hypothetical protein